eukprot:353560-Chlamydomonas_euryale.AAC.2
MRGSARGRHAIMPRSCSDGADTQRRLARLAENPLTRAWPLQHQESTLLRRRLSLAGSPRTIPQRGVDRSQQLCCRSRRVLRRKARRHDRGAVRARLHHAGRVCGRHAADADHWHSSRRGHDGGDTIGANHAAVFCGRREHCPGAHIVGARRRSGHSLLRRLDADAEHAAGPEERTSVGRGHVLLADVCADIGPCRERDVDAVVDDHRHAGRGAHLHERGMKCVRAFVVGGVHAFLVVGVCSRVCGGRCSRVCGGWCVFARFWWAVCVRAFFVVGACSRVFDGWCLFARLLWAVCVRAFLVGGVHAFLVVGVCSR